MTLIDPIPREGGDQQPMTSSPAPQRQPLQTHDLWRFVDRLTKDSTQRLVRQAAGGKPQVQYVKVPSLWTQLVEALASSNSSDGRSSKSTGSRSPLDLAIEALLREMSDFVREALISHGHHPRVLIGQPNPRAAASPAPRLLDDEGQPLLDPDLAGRLAERAARTTADTKPTIAAGRLRHDLKSDLRQLAAVVVGVADQDLVEWWADRYQSWVARAEEILTGDDEAIDVRGIRGHACPTCGALWVERAEPSSDPRALDGIERFRDPALVIAFRDGQVQHITCRACSTGWWRGDDVDHLAAGIRATTACTPAAQRAAESRPDYGDDPNHGGLLSGRSDDWWPWPDTGGSAA